MNDDVPDSTSKRNISIVKTVIAGIISPLIVAVIISYVTLYSTITRLTLLAEQSDRRITMMEQDMRKHQNDYRELQLVIAKQTQVLDLLYNELNKQKEQMRSIRH